MLRKPNEAELEYINNKIAKKIVTVEDCYILDAVPANDYALTVYSYYLGTSSLENFSGDLLDKNIPMLINHKADIPMGTWLPGGITKAGEGNHELKTSVYMKKDLTIGSYSTDELIKAYEAGHLTDVSVGWRDGKPICDICGYDIRDPKCLHFPGIVYEGTKATCTVHDAHLLEISLVWKGALPGAKLGILEEPCCDAMAFIHKVEGQCDISGWENIKNIPLDATLVFYQSASLIIPQELALTHNSKLADNEPNWSTWLTANRSKLPGSAFADSTNRKYPHHWVKGGAVDDDGKFVTGEMYLHRGGLNAAWAAANGARSGQDATPAIKSHINGHRKDIGLEDEDSFIQEQVNGGEEDMKTIEELQGQIEERQKQIDSLVEVLAKKDDAMDDLARKFADINSELEENKEYISIGKVQVDTLTKEYHRLGVALYAEKWNTEAEDEILNALSITEREKALNAKIVTMKEDIHRILTKEKEEIEVDTSKERKGHKDEDKYYKIV